MLSRHGSYDLSSTEARRLVAAFAQEKDPAWSPSVCECWEVITPFGNTSSQAIRTLTIHDHSMKCFRLSMFFGPIICCSDLHKSFHCRAIARTNMFFCWLVLANLACLRVCCSLFHIFLEVRASKQQGLQLNSITGCFFLHYSADPSQKKLPPTLTLASSAFAGAAASAGPLEGCDGIFLIFLVAFHLMSVP